LESQRPRQRQVLLPTHLAALTSNATVAPHRLSDVRQIAGNRSESILGYQKKGPSRPLFRFEPTCDRQSPSDGRHLHPNARLSFDRAPATVTVSKMAESQTTNGCSCDLADRADDTATERQAQGLFARTQHRPYCRSPSAHRPAVNADGTSLGRAAANSWRSSGWHGRAMFFVAHRQARSFESGGCGTSQDAKRFFEQQLACCCGQAMPTRSNRFT
jgi:hypothetical protein